MINTNRSEECPSDNSSKEAKIIKSGSQYSCSLCNSMIFLDEKKCVVCDATITKEVIHR